MIQTEPTQETQNTDLAVTANEPTPWQIAVSVAKDMQEILPKGLQNRPVAVYALMQYGAELGIGALQTLQAFYIVEGRISASAEFQRSQVLRAGHILFPKELSADKCVIYGRRADNPEIEMTFTWTISDAKRAGVVKPSSAWEKYPQAMNLARATSVVCRAIFPDVLAGISHTPEELEESKGISFTVENAAIEGETIDVQTTEDDYLDEPIKADPTAEKASEHFNRRPLNTQMKKAFAIFNNLPKDVQETAEEGRKTLFGDKSRKDYTKDEASKWIEYLLSLEEVERNG